MLNFKPITLESRRDLLPFLGKEHHSACYQSFATMYLWSGIYKTRYCLTGEWLFTKSGSGDGYGFPYGDGDLREGIELLRQDAKENGKELWFFGLLPTEKAWLEANYPGEFTYTASRDAVSYTHLAAALFPPQSHAAAGRLGRGRPGSHFGRGRQRKNHRPHPPHRLPAPVRPRLRPAG